MTEDLLALMTIVAVWKIVQSWNRRRKLVAAERSIDALRREVDYNATLLEAVTTFEGEPEPRCGTFHR
jgi:hypothetical protein